MGTALVMTTSPLHCFRSSRAANPATLGCLLLSLTASGCDPDVESDTAEYDADSEGSDSSGASDSRADAVLDELEPEEQAERAAVRAAQTDPQPEQPDDELSLAHDHGAMMAPVSDTRPLLVILLARDGDTPLFGSEAFYRDKIFGPGDPNVTSYFDAVSKGRFNYVEADVVSVVDSFDPSFLARAGATGMNGTTGTRLRSLMLADDAGFDFSEYDADGDGTVRADELAVLTIDNYSGGLGQDWGVPCVDHGGVQVCPRVALAGHRSSLMNFAHELSHQIGSIDIYGTGCHSSGATLMSCTASSVGSLDENTWLLDPWHRAEFGWTASGYVGGASGSVALSPVSTITGPFSTPGQERLVLQRPGTNERLIFEHRRRVGAYDDDVVREGIFAWYVDTDGAGRLMQIPSLTSGTDASLFTLAPDGCHADPSDIDSRGRTAPGYAPGSSYRFRWADGTDTGMLFTIGALQADGTMSVSWSTNFNAPSCPEPSALPDLVVESIAAAGCSGPGGDPRVRVEVRNAGAAYGRGWVDVFAGLSSPPSIGQYSNVYRMSPWLDAGESATMYFSIDASHQNSSKWIDVLLDTTQSTVESVETNNHEDQFVSLPDCSFG